MTAVREFSLDSSVTVVTNELFGTMYLIIAMGINHKHSYNGYIVYKPTIANIVCERNFEVKVNKFNAENI
jgi:hypothetical protein